MSILLTLLYIFHIVLMFPLLNFDKLMRLRRQFASTAKRNKGSCNLRGFNKLRFIKLTVIYLIKAVFN